jgi:catechol 2,3-dioxygenase-like lactoylglutathione lyase family enzyme
MQHLPDSILRMHHAAWRCRDAEETRAFYEDLLGLPLAHIIRADTVPSTGEYCPYVHLFFQLPDESFVAFFDLGDNQAAMPSPNTPAWVNHFAMKVESQEVLERYKRRLQAADVEVLGVTDHGIFRSIYFFDPNGIRMEMTVDMQETKVSESDMQKARQLLDAWMQEKAQRDKGLLKRR